jgi:membrane protein involved in colicin uptake
MAAAAVLSAQDPSPRAKVPRSTPEVPLKAAAAAPKATPEERHVRRQIELDKREAHADQLAGEARAEKRRAMKEKAFQAHLRQAEREALNKADKAKRVAEEAQKRAESHRRKAEELRARAEASWKNYQASLKPVSGPAPKPKAGTFSPKEEEKATPDTPKGE